MKNHVCDKSQDNDADWSRWRYGRIVEIRGGLDVERDLMRFVRLVMEWAVNLNLLHLDAAVTCKDCISTVQQSPSVVLYGFPECKVPSIRSCAISRMGYLRLFG
jgi:hypothetical protein